MKARITFFIGLFVFTLGIVQFIIDRSSVRLITVAVGIFFLIWGWKIGWTTYKRLTVLVGHLAITIGCLVVAYSVYQLPFITEAPSLLATIDLPLFWGIFTLCGGFCMIKHGHCKCCIRMHDKSN